MDTYAPFFIISAALTGDSRTGAIERTATLAHQLRAEGFAVDSVRGCYRGETEPALIAIPLASKIHDAPRTILKYARLYSQESVLAVDANRNARLLFALDADAEPATLGSFRNVPESEARKRDAWTERSGQYYVCGYAA